MNYKLPVRNGIGILLLLAMGVIASGADEGAAVYKTKCAGCHGQGGEGKPAIKAPALKGTSWDVDRMVQHITKGEETSKPPHKKGISGVTEAQAKSIAEFVKSLK
jgi:mono/diheme cytochrome c family protein